MLPLIPVVMQVDINQSNLEKLLREAYGISNITAFHPIERDGWNRIYKIETEPSLVLRISHTRKIESQLVFELDVIAHVAKFLHEVPQIRPTSSGDPYLIRNGVIYTLFEFKEGDRINAVYDYIGQAGRLLGHIHRVLSNYSHQQRYLGGYSIIDFDWNDNYFFSGDVFERAAELTPTAADEQKVFGKVIENISFLREARAVIERWLDNNKRQNRFTESIIHGDYYKGNLLAEDNEITAVLDWDETTTSWLEYEFANAMWEFSRDDARLDINPERSRSFMEAYISENRHLEIDEQSLSYLIAFRRLVEIHLGLYELKIGEPCDLDYCYQNLRYLKSLLSGT